MFNNQEYQYAYIPTATTTQVFTGRCVLHSIVVNTTAAGAISIIDNTTGSTVTTGILKASIAEGVYEYHIIMTKGIRIITAGASDITVCYSVT